MQLVFCCIINTPKFSGSKVTFTVPQFLSVSDRERRGWWFWLRASQEAAV